MKDLPIYDLYDDIEEKEFHEVGVRCWCEPTLKTLPDKKIVYHNSFTDVIKDAERIKDQVG